MLAVGAMLATGALGLFDDVTKVVQKRSLGLTPAGKMIGLTLIVCVFFVIAVNYCDVAPVIRFPGGFSIDLGILTTTLTISGMTIDIPWLYLVFVFLLLAGMSNAVNLTDGLDGLAGGTVMISMIVMAAVCLCATTPTSPYSARHALAAASAFCGSTPIPRRSSWVTRAPSPWVVLWPPSPCLPTPRSSPLSWAACSSPRRFR